MTLEPVLLALLLTGASPPESTPSVPSVAEVQSTPAALPPPPSELGEPTPDPALDKFRSPLDGLMERMLGTSSRAVRFDWRKSKVGFGVTASQLLELNSFNSERVGLFVRKPLGNLMGELALTRTFSSGSPSTDALALTPYRQAGRPGHWELDANLGYPLAEGVATARPGFFPATQLVLMLDAGLRYRYYDGQWAGAKFGEIAKDLLAPKLSQAELDRLEPQRLPGMQLDNGRYDLLGGFSLDVFFGSGGFVTPRVMAGIPLLEIGQPQRIGLYWELSLAVGWTL